MGKISRPKLPEHIAIIMDGNTRWAKKRGLPQLAGHYAGMKAVERIVRAAKNLGIKVLTLYAFSTENWNRPQKIVNGLMGLIEEYVDLKTDQMHKEGVKARVIGRSEGLPPKVRAKLRHMEEKTAGNTSLMVNFAVNYGGRAEIVDAVKKICEDTKRNALDPGKISEENFSDYLYTRGLPDPDILIRTSGEMRVSNFLLWQISYSEIYVTPKLWPDFQAKDLEKAVLDYRARERKYGR